MAFHKVSKVVIITEKIIAEPICAMIEKTVATGYTLSNVAGKGSRDIRSSNDGTNLVGEFANVKIEIIVKNKSVAEEIIEKVNKKYFQNYSGIAFIEEVEILRLHKFVVEGQ